MQLAERSNSEIQNKAKKMQSFFSKIREKKSPTKKGIKIAFLSKPERKIGIAAESLQTLKQKVKLKFYEDVSILLSNNIYLLPSFYKFIQ